MITRLNLCRAWLVLLALTTALPASEPMTWPRFDGPEYNRVSRERRVELSWNDALPVSGEAIELVPVASEDSDRPGLWEIEDLPGEQPPLVFNDKLYLLHRESTAPENDNAASEGEPAGSDGSENQPASDKSTVEDSSATSFRYAIDCWLVQGRDQQARFRYRLPEVNSAPQAGRPLPQPQLAGDPLWRQLFCLTGEGNLHVLDSDLGSQLWSIDLSQLLAQETAPSRVAAPLIFEHLVIVSLGWESSQVGGSGESESVLVALDRRNGQVHWVKRSSSAASDFARPAPVLCIINDTVAVVSQLSPGEIEFSQANTGKTITTLPLASPNAVAVELLCESGRLAILETTNSENAPQPWAISVFQLQQDNGKAKGPDVAAADTVKGAEVDTHDSAPPRMTTRVDLGEHDDVTALLRGPNLFAATSSGLLRQISLTADKSERDLPLSSVGAHEMIWIDGQLLITGVSGHWQVYSFAPGSADAPAMLEKVYVELWEQPLIGPPVVAKQRIYVRHGRKLVALGSFDEQKAVSDLLVPFADRAVKNQEADNNERAPATQILLVPAIQELQTGFEVTFQVFGYDERGRFTQRIPAEEVEWSWNSAGDFSSDSGVLTAPATLETAESADLQVRWKGHEASSTVRLVPRAAPF